jgi:hypothetical protein
LSQDNKALVMRLFNEVFTTRNLSAADDIMAEEFLEHAGSRSAGRSLVRSRVLRTPGRWSVG